MILLNDKPIVPLMFPDKTSQIWKVEPFPEAGTITWRFEHEGELMHVAQLSCLIPGAVKLFMPYLPYARQDKPIANDQTFALKPFATLLNRMHFEEVAAIDVHNPERTASLIERFVNCEPRTFHTDVTNAVEPTVIIFPDTGAAKRYNYMLDYPKIIFEKKRDQSTGKIIGSEIVHKDTFDGRGGGRAIIVDDICDGGATFLGIATVMKEQHPQMKLHLMVTHGIFSKGRKILEDAGMNLWTTNTLPQNASDFPVTRNAS